VLGVGVAVAAISIVAAGRTDPAMAPLSTAAGLIVNPAFGPDDEDCTLATRPQVLPNGRLRLERHLVCVH
jgi:hypothetical protein